jgi:serine-type D-Ala-D-Ala endopeptidase (penicillin-binding protein 7)
MWFAVLLMVQFSLGCSDRSGPDSVLASSPPPAPIENPLVPYLDPKKLYLRSDVALIIDGPDGRVLYEKNINTRQPIASLTKLMTAMVILDAGLPEDEVIRVVHADRDRLRGSGSKLSFGTQLTRHDLLKIALAASENRAAAALGRTYPGGTEAMVTAMNGKAKRLGMHQTAFRDPAGLHEGNLSTAADLYTLVEAAYRYPEIRDFSTLGTDYVTDLRTGWKIRFVNTNRLVRNGKWDIDLSKTGYIAQAGHCLVMRAEIADRPVIVVLLNSWGELTKYGDANRIRKWFNRAEKKAQETPHPLDDATG